ncbi:MAG TPA: type II toxin-antitoxin system PemK/MazF family toxin [Candidatus Paceibacterota bacterium]|nr:type II toxin-antitoxin system PemK/MazF family toxin [Candidatus Paceibacterota bacterium]
MVNKYIPSQGDIIWLSFNPTRGHEEAGFRPALVISRTEYNTRSGMMLCCPITSKSKGYKVHIPLTGIAVKGFVLCDQARSIDWYIRKPRFIEKCADETFFQVTNIIINLIQ